MKISDLYNKHKDKMCFILGAGPSLHFADVEPLKDYITITVNSGIIKAKWCDYFLSDDIGVSSWEYYQDVLPRTDCTKLLYRDKLSHKCSHLKNVLLFDHTWWYSPSEEKYNPPGIILNKTGPIIGAITSVGSAVHFAYIMGCNPIVLLGCDCCYKDGHRYFWQYEGEEKTERKSRYNNVIDDNYFESIYRGGTLNYWNEMYKANSHIIGKEVEIIDASDGLINCFRKMSVKDILLEYGSKKK